MEGSSRWLVGVVTVLVFGALGVGFWSQARGDDDPALPAPLITPAGTPSSGPDRLVAPTVPPSPDEPSEPEDRSEPEQTDGPGPRPAPEYTRPAEGPWAELLPAARVSHTDTDPDTAFPWDLVGYFQESDPTGFSGGNPSGDWTNKAEIWDSLAPVLRDEVAALGEPTDDPVWPEANPNEARGQTRWSDTSTGGRGELVEFMAQFLNSEGVVVERVQAALVSTNADGSGIVVARMEPFEVEKDDYPGFLEYIDHVAETEWAWVQQQPVLP